MTSFKIPWIHSLFENASSVASGIAAILRKRGLENEINVVALGGDGATFDIGLGNISGMWERNDNVLYVCYDNEGYQNTGYQGSGSTPLDANTTTTPAGKESFGSQLPKKDMVSIALAHHLPYVATTSVGYPMDVIAKVKKALSIKGSRYLQIYCPCVPGWGIEPKETLTASRLAVQTGIYPILEYVNGKLTKKQKITKKAPVEELMKFQKRYKHLFKSPEGKKQIEIIQKSADDNIEKFGLI